jgi:hypothetical protein
VSDEGSESRVGPQQGSLYTIFLISRCRILRIVSVNDYSSGQSSSRRARCCRRDSISTHMSTCFDSRSLNFLTDSKRQDEHLSWPSLASVRSELQSALRAPGVRDRVRGLGTLMAAPAASNRRPPRESLRRFSQMPRTKNKNIPFPLPARIRILNTPHAKARLQPWRCDERGTEDQFCTGEHPDDRADILTRYPGLLPARRSSPV